MGLPVRMCSSPKACRTGIPEEWALQRVPGRRARSMSGPVTEAGIAGLGAGEVVPVPGHRDAGELPVAGGGVLAAGDFGGGGEGGGGGLGEAGEVDVAGEADGGAEAEAGEVRDREAGGLRDVAEGVGALVAEGGGVRGAAAADGVEDEEEGARHQAMRPRMSGASAGAVSAMR